MATKYTKEILEEAVKQSFSFAGVLRYLGLIQAGGTQFHIANKVKEFDIDYSHFTGQSHNRGKVSTRRKTAEEVLILRSGNVKRQHSYLLRRSLIEIGVKEECNRCSLAGMWNGKPIVLEVNHIDGDWKNDRRENLEFICPNCHSQEDSTNRPSKFRKISGYVKKTVCDCGKEKARKSVKCRACHNKYQKDNPAPLSSEVDYPEFHELLRLVNEYGYSKVGRDYGVSDNAVRKRLEREKSLLNGKED